MLGLGGLGHMGVQIAAAKGADVTVLSRSLRKEKFAEKLGATRTLATSDDNFFRDHRGEFDFILNTISALIDVSAYLKLLKPRGVMACVGLPPEELGLQVPRCLPVQISVASPRPRICSISAPSIASGHGWKRSGLTRSTRHMTGWLRAM